MNYKNEKLLLFIIKYGLPILIISFSIFITTFLYYENKTDLKDNKKSIEEEFILNEKELIKEHIDNLYTYIIKEQKDTEKSLKESLKKRVQQVHKIITNLHNQYQDTHTKEELRIMIKAAIKDIRFNNNRGYFFIFDNKATSIIHSLLPQIEGKNFLNYKDPNGNFSLRDSIELLKTQNELAQEWYWKKTKEDKKIYKKVGYLKNIYELDWILGTGEYIDEFSKDIQKKVLSQIKKLKFGTNSYFIVTDKDNNYLSHIKQELIGENALTKLKEMNDNTSIEKIQKVIKSKEGFVYLDFFKPNSKVVSSKITYLRTIPKWDWIISTGFYKDDANKIITKQQNKITKRYNNNLKNIITITVVITILLLILSFYISNTIKNKFNAYRCDIDKHIEENKKQYELLSQKSKLSAMGEMLGNIAHQWRQPLSLITTAASGIKLNKQMNMLDDIFLESSLNSINNAANHLSETIEDFRDFFKPEKEKNSFNLNDVIDKALKLISSEIKINEIKIIKECDNIEVISYERELIQVLLNIINNANDAFKENNIFDNKYIFINIYKKEDRIFIEIQDNANGIDEDIIKRVFEPYFTTKHKSQGTGIGLYMSQEIITKHMNGKLNVRNKTYIYNNIEYKGALFTISIKI